MTETVRLAKRVAELFQCSRGQAVLYIENGGVAVDGVTVEESGFRVLPQSAISLQPNASLAPALPVTIVINKPAGVSPRDTVSLIIAANQAADDQSGLHLLKRHLHDLHLLDPLDTTAAGLVVLTQDWRVKRKLVDDLARVEQEYIAEVSGHIMPDGLALLNQGLVFNGKQVPTVKASWQNETRLRFAIKGATARLIDHVCGKVGLAVVSIRRIRIGRLPMSSLPIGQWRYLSEHERF